MSRDQHDLITHDQLVALGYSAQGIQHRIDRGRLHPVHRGVYAVGRPVRARHAKWMAAVLACGPTAALSHDSAAELWQMTREQPSAIHVSVLSQRRSRDGIVVHRRTALNTTTKDAIRVTTPAQTLIDVAGGWPRSRLEQAIGEADLRRIVSLKALRTAATNAGKSGAPLRSVIERLTVRVTQSELERGFLRLVRQARLPLPDTQVRFGSARVDFYWPQVGLVVETDGGFHRTAAQQLADRRRDQEHARSGRTVLRVMHAQVFFEHDRTAALLVDVFTECQCRRGSASNMRAA